MNQLHQPVAPHLPQLVQGLAHRRQCRGREAGRRNIVKPDQRDIRRTAPPQFIQFPQRAQRHLVVEREQRSQIGVRCQQLLRRLHPALLGQPPISHLRWRKRNRSLLQHLQERLKNIAAGLNFAQPTGQKPDPLVAESHQMLGHLPRAIFVVGHHIVQIQVLGVIVDQHKRPRPVRQFPQKLVARVGANEQNTVHHLLLVKLQVFPAFNELRPRHFQHNLVPELGCPVMNPANNLAEVHIRKRVAQLRQ